MKTYNIACYYLILALTFLFITSCSKSYKETERGFMVAEDSVHLLVSCIDARTVHIQTYPKSSEIPERNLILDDSTFPIPEFNIKTSDNKIILQTENLLVEYDVSSRNIVFKDAESKEPIVTEKPNSRTLSRATIGDEECRQIRQTFILTDDEALYGLGQYQEGLMNYRGQSVNLVQANMEIVNPFLLSTLNYGILWNNYSKTIFTDNAQGASFWSEVADGIDYYFVYGNSMNDVILGYRNLTGQVPMQPKSAFGFWQSKERYKSFAELTNVVKEYRKRQIPIDNIVQDWEYWGNKDHWNSLEFDPTNFDQAEEVINVLHNKYKVKLTLSVWPGFGKKTKVYQALDSIGALFNEPTWAGYKVVDIYNPQARNIFWNYLYKGLYTKGVDGWWMDATEPSFREGFTQDKQEARSKSAGKTHIGSFHRYLSTYSLVLSQMMYDNLRQQSDKRISVLTRSAFAGQQKYGTSVWSGDIYASWDVLALQIPAGLNFSMTGIPYWTSDIGAFNVIKEDGKGNGGYSKGLSDPAYLELYTRWFQFGAFSPIFRAHGTDVPREIWQFGSPGTPFYDAQLKMINMRYSLLSYIYSEAWKVTSEGSTMMKALVLDFTDDKNTYNNKEGYMFGSSLLVYPILRPMYYNRDGKISKTETTVEVYLPQHKGNIWYDLNSTNYYSGKNTISYNAPLDIIPLFAKSGSIIPRNKVVQHVDADDGHQIDIYIYAGDDAEFTLYEDDNETYKYEQEEYSTIKMKWDNKKRQVVILEPKGKLKNRLEERIFNIIVVEPTDNNKYKETEKQIVFNNKEVSVLF